MREATLNDLEEYRGRRAEIKSLREQLRGGSLLCVDTVRGSQSEWPYTEVHMAISGYEERRAERLRTRIAVLLEGCEAAEVWVAALDSSEDRALMGMHYLEGYTWQQAADELGRPREIISRRAKELKKNLRRVPKSHEKSQIVTV